MIHLKLSAQKSSLSFFFLYQTSSFLRTAILVKFMSSIPLTALISSKQYGMCEIFFVLVNQDPPNALLSPDPPYLITIPIVKVHVQG